MQILFYDVATPIVYTNQTLLARAMGGTEATIIRVAHALKNHHTIYIAQHRRAAAENEISDGVHYISLETAQTLSPDIVVLLREYEWIDKVGKQFPHARHYFWIHNLAPRDFYSKRKALIDHAFEIIAVSDFHRQTIERRLQGKWYQRIWQFKQAKSVPIHVIYNPIDEALDRNDTPVNPHQLIFMSSPHKGLAETLEKFNYVLSHYPDYQLLICNPGNWDHRITIPSQATFLGALPHHDVIEHVRRSLCVFYPQTQRVETFGLVYAESNAVGTPVLAHDLGAAREVLSSSEQFVDGNDNAAILKKLEAWQKQRPNVRANPAFRISQVTKTWLELIRG